MRLSMAARLCVWNSLNFKEYYVFEGNITYSWYKINIFLKILPNYVVELFLHKIIRYEAGQTIPRV